MFSAWRALPGSAHILIRHEFGREDYAVQATDLRFLFEERVSKQNIQDKARDQDCSIDPSDDDKQLRFLLKKLQAGLDGEEGTTLRILGGLDEQSPSKLELHVSSTLPHGLADLVWKFNLRTLPPHALKKDLVVPLLGLVYTEQQRLQELIGIIREKDTVITRILDKFDSTGIDFGNIFPTASVVKHRKGNQVESFRKAVKGLGEFNETTWRRSSLQSIVDDASPSEFRGLGDSLPSLSTPVVLKNAERICIDGVCPRSEGNVEKENIPEIKTENTQQSVASVDQFQKQLSPARSVDEDGTTLSLPEKDEAELSTTSEGSDTKERQEHGRKSSVKPKGQKLGVLGGGRFQRKDTSPSNAENTNFDIDEDLNTADRASDIALGKGRPKLGQIGGRKQYTEHFTSSLPDKKVTESPPKVRRTRLGQLGGRREEVQGNDEQEKLRTIHTASAPTKVKEEPQSQEIVRADAIPQHPTAHKEEVEEDAAEKANRRREELKRQMEEKTKAQTKKKRRF